MLEFDEDRKVSSVVISCTFEAEFEVPEEIESNPEALEEFVDEMFSSKEMLMQSCDGGLIGIKYKD